jgi:chromate transporter
VILSQLWTIFYTFAKVGIFGYGGGPSFIPLIEAEVVNRHHWLTEAEFVDALAMGNALPGPIATKMAAYVGYRLAGYSGATAGVIGMILPSAVLMLALAFFLLKHKDHPMVKGAMTAVRPAIVALLAFVVYDIFPHSIISWEAGIIAVVVFALAILHWHPALLIVLSAAVGVFLFGRV